MAAPEAAAPEGDWEASKENFQPLKTGRKGTALRDSTVEQRGKAVEERRRAFWDELAAYSGDDPLEVWLRFIKWTQEAFSAGGHKAELLPLLERCTRELQALGRYAGDVRYLRVWVQYADCLPDPGDVFSFLKENEIGQEHALYYLAAATYREARGGYAAADALYQQGINRLAAPLDRLRAKYQEFQQRMARRIQRKAAEQSSQEAEQAAADDHPERTSLGFLGGGGGRGRAAGGRAGAGAGGGLLGAGMKRKAAGAAASAAADPAGNGAGSGLAIFVDEEFGAGGGAGGPAASAPAAAAAVFQPGRSAAAPWTKLGGFEAGRKENAQRAGMWTGQRIKQQPVHSAPVAAPLEVFEDPELVAVEEEAEAPGGGAARPTLRQRLEGGGGRHGAAALGEEDALRADPLHLHKVLAGAGAAAQVPGGLAVAPEAAAKRRREEVLAFDPAALLGGDGEELCFEELRASLWLQQQQQTAAAAESQAAVQEGEGQQQQPEDVPAEVDAAAAAQLPDATMLVSAEAGSPPALPAAPGDAAETQLEAAGAGDPVGEEEPADTAGVDGQQQLQQQQQQHGGGDDDDGADVTLSTRDALAAINQMFGGAVPAGAALASAGDLAPSGSAAVEAATTGGGAPPPAAAAALDPTLTVSTRDAYAALDKMFKGSLPLERASLPPTTAAAGAALAPSHSFSYAEPTMTINTKVAMDAINQMFKGSLSQEHPGWLPPTSAGPAGAYEPTMTISTRAALEAVNSMFGGRQQQQPTAAAAQQQQPSHHQGRSFAAPAAPGLPPPPPPGFHPATAGMQGGLADSPGSGNGGGGFMIHEDTQFVSVPLGLADGGGSDAGASPLLSPAASLGGGDGDSGGLFGGGFSIREDTMFVTVPVSVAAEQQLEEEDDDDGEGMQQQQQQQQAVGSVPAVPSALLGQPAAGGGEDSGGLFGGGFSIREDTQFIGGGGGGAPPPAQGSPAAASDGGYSDASIDALAAGGGGSGGVLGRKRPLGSPCISEEEGGDEHSASGAAQVGKWGFAPGADDTLALQLQLGDTQALLDAVTAAAAADPLAALQLQAAAGGASSSGLTLHLQGLQLGGEDKENLVSAAAAAAAAATCGRRLSDPSVAAAALQLLAAQRCEELGVCQEALDAEQVAVAVAEELAAGDAAAGDSFAVWCDTADDGSPPLMGSPLGSGNSCQADAAPAANGGAAVSPPVEPAPLAQNQQQPEAPEAGQGAGPPAGLQTPATPAAALTGSDDAAAKGEALPSSPCDPFSPAFQSRMLACLEPAVAEWPGVHCLSAAEEAEAAAGFKAARRGGSSGGLVELQLCGLEFAVSGVVGEGAYARVFRGVDGDCADVALKLQAPPCPWEWYVCKALAGRLPPPTDGAPLLHRCFINPTALLLGGGSSLLVAPLGLHGSLQDLLNAFLGGGGGGGGAQLAPSPGPPGEALAMHFAAQLLRLVGHMHAARILHTDIKPDNLLITLEGGGGESEGAEEEAGAGHQQQHDGDDDGEGDCNAAAAAAAGGAPHLGLQLIDFGRAVDLELLPLGCRQLRGDSGTDAFRCVEMREGGAWLWQADAHGVAATVHTLLYGRYMEVERVRDNATGAVSLRPTQPLKRKWAQPLWERFFACLLNHADAAAPPPLEDLAAAFEAHLAGGAGGPGGEAAARRQQLRQELRAAAALLPSNRC